MANPFRRPPAAAASFQSSHGLFCSGPGETPHRALCIPLFSPFFEDVLGKPVATWEELEKAHRFVSEARPELFGATFAEANDERTKTEQQTIVLATNPAVMPAA
jgi:hypothetical protein